MKKHSKHSKLNRRDNGNYAPLEISILGSNCTLISSLIEQVSVSLKDEFKLAYIDASHNDKLEKPVLDNFTFSTKGMLKVNSASYINAYNEKIRLAQYDVCFINGNHFEGKKQIIILDGEKENSIIKRIGQINDILFFVLKDENSKIFDCLKDKFKNIDDISVFKISEIENISQHIKNYIESHTAKLNGLVLAGGKSIRMGTDKSELKYYGKEHSLYLMDLLIANHLDSYLSKNKKNDTIYSIITDRFLDLGPFGAICSAFMKFPNQAFLVLATDLPFINSELIARLISERDPSKIATAVKGKLKEFPEPLITIWEPKAYPILMSYLSQGYSCPRKVLINSDVKIIEVEDSLISNVNTKEEFEQVKSSLK